MPHPPPGYFANGLEADPELAAAINGELARQRDGIELIASENIVSRLVLAAQGSVLTNKTVEGAAYARYYGGAEFADAIEALAIDRAKKLFNCRFANLQPHSGSNANAGVFLGLLKLGDTILSMNVAAGGHISHGHPATLAGRDYRIVHYGVNRDSELIDLDELRDLARAARPKMIVAGARPIRARSIFPACARSRMKWARFFSSIWRISPGSSLAGFIRIPSRTPMW
jgi:glycine hydroxymethyltransferase